MRPGRCIFDVLENDGIVLVSRQGLFATPFTAENDKGKLVSHVAELLGTQKVDQAQQQLVIEQCNHAHQFPGRDPGTYEMQDQVLNLQMIVLQLIEGNGVINITDQLLRRVRLQTHDIRDGDDPGQAILLVDDTDPVNVILGNPVECFKDEIVFIDRDQRRIHNVAGTNCRRVDGAGNNLVA